jgi:hypothetical protein
LQFHIKAGFQNISADANVCIDFHLPMLSFARVMSKIERPAAVLDPRAWILKGQPNEIHEIMANDGGGIIFLAGEADLIWEYLAGQI